MEFTDVFARANGALHDVCYHINQLYREDKAFRAAHPIYSENHVFDKNKGEAWNKEEAERRHNEREKGLEKYNAQYDAYFEEARNVIRKYIQQEFGLPQPIVNKVYLKASKKVKYAGWFDILNAAREIGEEVKELLDLYEQSKS